MPNSTSPWRWRKTWRERIKQEQFSPTWMSYFFNNLLILRASLRGAIVEHSGLITGKVLDFGCGSKPYEEIFTHATSYIGVDSLDSSHDHSQSKVDVFWDGKKLPFPDSSFDSCISTEVFEHVPQTDLTLLEVNRILIPGGKFLVSTPFFYGEHESPNDFYRFTSFGLVHKLKQSGFEVIATRKTSHKRGVICFYLINYLGGQFLRIGLLGAILFVPVITGLNLIGRLPSFSPSSGNQDVYLNLVVIAEKK